MLFNQYNIISTYKNILLESEKNSEAKLKTISRQ